MLNSEIYAKGVQQAICPAGRMLRQLHLNIGWVKGECYITYESGDTERVLFPVRVTSDITTLTWEQFSILRDAAQHPPSEDEDLFAYWSGLVPNHDLEVQLSPFRLVVPSPAHVHQQDFEHICPYFSQPEGCSWGTQCPHGHWNSTGHDSAPLCRDYMSGTGCSQGRLCHLRHPYVNGKCYICGSTRHDMFHCPVRARQARERTKNAITGIPGALRVQRSYQ